MPRAITAREGVCTDLAVLESAVCRTTAPDVSSVGMQSPVTQAIQHANCSRHLGEASPSEFVVAHEDLLPQLVGGMPSPFSDLLETRACILSHPAAVGEAKHIRPARQDSPRQARELQQQRPHCPERIVSEAQFGNHGLRNTGSGLGTRPVHASAGYCRRLRLN
jgi:hypothetical protein